MDEEVKEQQSEVVPEEAVAVSRTYVMRRMGDGVVGVRLSALAVHVLWTPERGLHYCQGGPEAAERLRAGQAEFLAHEVRALSERCQECWFRWYGRG